VTIEGGWGESRKFFISPSLSLSVFLFLFFFFSLFSLVLTLKLRALFAEFARQVLYHLLEPCPFYFRNFSNRASHLCLGGSG
jgi:hypothetical protein